MGIKHADATITVTMLTGLAFIVAGLVLAGTRPNLAIFLCVVGGLITILGHRVEKTIYPNRKWR